MRTNSALSPNFLCIQMFQMSFNVKLHNPQFKQFAAHHPGSISMPKYWMMPLARWHKCQLNVDYAIMIMSMRVACLLDTDNLHMCTLTLANGIKAFSEVWWAAWSLSPYIIICPTVTGIQLGLPTMQPQIEKDVDTKNPAVAMKYPMRWYLPRYLVYTVYHSG